jgi:hypothetical protein
MSANAQSAFFKKKKEKKGGRNANDERGLCYKNHFWTPLASRKKVFFFSSQTQPTTLSLLFLFHHFSPSKILLSNRDGLSLAKKFLFLVFNLIFVFPF